MHYNTVGLRLKQAGVSSRIKRLPAVDIPDTGTIVEMNKRGLSQTNIARQLGVSQSFVSKRLKRVHQADSLACDEEGLSAPDEGAMATSGKADDESQEQPCADATGAADNSASEDATTASAADSAAGAAQDQEAQEKLAPLPEEGKTTANV